MKVTMHKASDGEFFEKHSDFVAHEANLRLINKLETVVFRGTATDALAMGEDDDIDHVELIKAFVVENAEQLRALLNDAMIVRRKSPTKQAAA